MLFRRGPVGLCLVFRTPGSAGALRTYVETTAASHAAADAAPSIADLRALGIMGDEDITSYYQRSFVGETSPEDCGFLFDPETRSVEVDTEGTRSDDVGTLVEIGSSADSDLSHVGWKSDEEWLSDGGSSQEVSDDEIFYDTTEAPEYMWFEVDV